jgi:hypothetical protein
MASASSEPGGPAKIKEIPASLLHIWLHMSCPSNWLSRGAAQLLERTCIRMVGKESTPVLL